MKTIGIVDIGSNSTRLSIYRGEGTSIKLLLNKKKMTGLAQYVVNGAMTREGIREAVSAVKSFRQLLNNLDVSEMYVLATASLRNISNSYIAAKAIEEATGVRVDVISGEEEGELSFYGAMQNVDMEDGMLIDLGGGSTEIVHFFGSVIEDSYSVSLGSLSLYRLAVKGIFPTEKELKHMKTLVKEQLKLQEKDFSPAENVCGVGGTIRAVCRLVNEYYEKPDECREFSFEELNDIYDIIKKDDDERRNLLLQVVPDRLHTILPGIVILRTVMKLFKSKKVAVSVAGVREGYLLKKVFASGEK